MKEKKQIGDFSVRRAIHILENKHYLSILIPGLVAIDLKDFLKDKNINKDKAKKIIKETIAKLDNMEAIAKEADALLNNIKAVIYKRIDPDKVEVRLEKKADAKGGSRWQKKESC